MSDVFVGSLVSSVGTMMLGLMIWLCRRYGIPEFRKVLAAILMSFGVMTLGICFIVFTMKSLNHESYADPVWLCIGLVVGTGTLGGSALARYIGGADHLVKNDQTKT